MNPYSLPVLVGSLRGHASVIVPFMLHAVNAPIYHWRFFPSLRKIRTHNSVKRFSIQVKYPLAYFKTGMGIQDSVPLFLTMRGGDQHDHGHSKSAIRREKPHEFELLTDSTFGSVEVLLQHQISA